MTKTYREESKVHYRGTAEKTTIEQINCGSLQRIADATEAMAKRFNDLIEENRWLTSSRKMYMSENETLKRQLANRKGQITKLKNKLRDEQKGPSNDSE